MAPIAEDRGASCRWSRACATAAVWWLVAVAARGQSPSDEAKVSAWATGGTSTTATPGAGDGRPATSAAALPYWQAPAVPQAVVQGGAIPQGWKPQAIPYHGIGPDGKPITMFVAPTYVFTYQSGPAVPAVPVAALGVNRSVPAAMPTGWNYATSGAPPVNPALPPATVTRYPPVPYQFPADAKALAGTPIVPPSGSPMPPPSPQTWASAPAPPVAATPPAPPPPTQWVPSAPPPAAAAAPVSGDWVTVVPPAVASAALAGGATAAGDQAARSTPAQPVSAGPAPAPASVAAPHLWRVVGVQDGDTLMCLDETNQQQRVRLADIDAPEIAQDYGKASREALASLVFGKTVEVSDRGRDDAGRWVARVMVEGVDVNRQMVASGSAWFDSASSTDQALAASQEQAQAQRLGLWSATTPTPPWVFRQGGGAS